MNRIITSDILVAYYQCPRKAFLLMCTKICGSPHEYVENLKQQCQTNQRKYLDILKEKPSNVQTYEQDTLKNSDNILFNTTLKANGLVAECAILTKVRTHSILGCYSYEPTIFVGTHNIKKEQKLELFFISYVLEQLQNSSL